LVTAIEVTPLPVAAPSTLPIVMFVPLLWIVPPPL
jgi:hypothetical protein